MAEVPMISIVEAPTAAPKRRVRFSESADVSSANASLLGKNLASPSRGDNVFRPRRERWYKDAEERMAKIAAASTAISQRQPIHVNQYLACAALGFDYLAANLQQQQQGHQDPSSGGDTEHIEVDDLLAAVEAPWSLAAEHHLTLQELFCIVESFISSDPRFKGKYEATCLPMHVRRTESTTSAAMMDDEVCARERPLSLSAFRQCLSEDALTFDRFKIICFDPEVMSEAGGVHAQDSNKNKGQEDDQADVDRANAASTVVAGCALVTEIQRSRGTVNIAQVVDGEVRRSEVLARTLYNACSTRHKELHRVQGIIDVRLQGSLAATNVEVSMMVHDISTTTSGDQQQGLSGSMHTNSQLSVFESSHSSPPIPCIYGTSWRRQTLWNANAVPYVMHDTTVLGSHVTTTALAFHLCNPTRFPEIPTNKLVAVTDLPLVELGRSSCPEVNSWYSIVKYFADQMSPDTSVHFVPSSGRRAGLSLQQLVDLTIAISNANEKCRDDGGESGRAALLVAVDINKARGSLNLSSPELNESAVYAIVAGISESGDQMLLIDGDTRHSEISWTVQTEQLHAAIVGNGVLLLRHKADGADLLPAGDRKELLEAQKLLLPYQPRSFVVSAAEARAVPTPIGLCCMACEKIGHLGFQRNLLHLLPCNISHLLVNDPSVEDLARVINFVSAAPRRDSTSSAGTSTSFSVPEVSNPPQRTTSPGAAASSDRRVVCRAIRLEVNRVKQRKMTGTGFAHAVRNALACNSQILFHFKRSLLTNIPKYEGAASQYALAESLTSHDTIQLQDTNPKVHLSRWQCSLADLYKACSADCCATRRPGGLLIISSNANSAEDVALVNMIRATRQFSPFYVPSSHAFRSPLVVQLTAVAMAAHALGVRVCPEQVLYRSAQSSNIPIADAVSHVVSLQRRLALSDLCLICNAFFDDQGLELKLSVPHGSSRTGRLTKSDVHGVLSKLQLIEFARRKSGTLKEVLIGVYDVREAKDVADAFSSAGVLVGMDPNDSGKLVLLEGDPASWGMFARSSIDDAVEWFSKPPDDPTANLFGICALAKTATQHQNEKAATVAMKSGWSSDEDE